MRVHKRRTDSKRWRGPAENRSLLVAAENLRYVSSEGAMAAEAVTKTPGIGSRQKTILTSVRRSNHPRMKSSKNDVKMLTIFVDMWARAKPGSAKASEPQANTCQIITWRSASHEKEAAHHRCTGTSTGQRCDGRKGDANADDEPVEMVELASCSTGIG